MVRAILDGRKTQTRRVVKLPHNNPLGTWEPTTAGGGSVKYVGDIPAPEIAAIWHTRTGECYVCPHGDVGDRLWVRETWKPRVSHSCALDTCDCADLWVDYQAAGDGVYFPERKIDENWTMPEVAMKGRWVPSIHMPRWASRITLEIVGVRAERLQDISESDAIAEGVESPESERFERDWSICPRCGGTRLYDAIGANGGVLPDTDCLECDTHVKRYRHLWDSLNSARGYGWDKNSWVWVVEFRRIES